MAHALSSLEAVIARSLKSAFSSIPLGFSHYLKARQVLRGSISKRSRLGLDWLNFFLADIQTGFGAFVAFYLADLGWDKGQVGLALSAGTVAGLIAHLPGGAIVDWVPWKRSFAALGILMIAVSALILAVAPTFVLVFAAEILHGLTGGIVTPAIAAISLGLVGRSAMSAPRLRAAEMDCAESATAYTNLTLPRRGFVNARMTVAASMANVKIAILPFAPRPLPRELLYTPLPVQWPPFSSSRAKQPG
jgi:MFS family permease